jgi:hypothetical protein
MTSPTQSQSPRTTSEEGQPNPSLGADVIIADALDPVFVSDLEAGCNDYDIKLIEFPRLLAKIEAALAKKLRPAGEQDHG